MTLKILLVSRCAWTLYNFRSGLIRALKNRGETVIGGGAGGDGFEVKIKELGIPFVPLPVNKKGIHPLADVRLFWTLFRWYRKEKPDIVHHFTIKPVIYGSIAAHFAGVPRIVNTITGLGYVFTDNYRWFLRLMVEMLYRFALNSSHFTFFQNPEDQHYFLEHRLVNLSTTALLPGSGVDTSHFLTKSESRNGHPSPIRFLMVSRLLADKGIFEFVEAARLIKEKRPDVSFQILGKRDERNPTAVPHETLESWESKKDVSLLGEVEDVRPVIADCDVVVLPSYREGIPRSLLEAAAMGKPIITTDTVGCREVVENGVNGLLVPIKNPKALAEAMVYLIENPEIRARMGKAGRKKVVEQFDEEIVLEKVFKIYYIDG